MNPDQLVQTMTPEVYQRLKDSVETGKWLDGTTLSDTQRETCLQAIIMYQAKHLNNDQHMSVGPDGEIIHLSRQELKKQLNADSVSQPQSKFNSDSEIARFKQDDF